MKSTTINFNHIFTRRIFNNGSWSQGGRFYGGWWQRLPKEMRKQILIEGKSVIEIDFSGLHIVLLYALEGIDYWKDIGKDPYEVTSLKKDYPKQYKRIRKLFKDIFLVSINARSKTAAIKAIQTDVNRNPHKYPWKPQISSKIISMVVDHFQAMHSPIAEYICSGYGVKLQNMDSKIAESVINEMTKMGAPVLCIHDSFIATSNFETKLEGLMIEGFHTALKDSETKLKDPTSIIPILSKALYQSR
nr:hypothetical protein [uncultured Desulfobacter sp.]